MSLRDFQRAMCDLAASPTLCTQVRRFPRETLEAYNLTPRETRRLTSAVWQRGMSVNCTLYRVNRITPVYTLLPLTCFLLGDDLIGEMEAFWAAFPHTDLQYRAETARFAQFLRGRIQPRQLHNAFLREVLDFELAANELRFAPRRQIVRELAASSATKENALRPHPLVRVVAFQHDPVLLLETLAAGHTSRFDFATGDFFLLVDGRAENLTFAIIEPALARELLGPAGTEREPNEHKVLAEAGLLVPIPSSPTILATAGFEKGS